MYSRSTCAWLRQRGAIVSSGRPCADETDGAAGQYQPRRPHRARRIDRGAESRASRHGCRRCVRRGAGARYRSIRCLLWTRSCARRTSAMSHARSTSSSSRTSSTRSSPTRRHADQCRQPQGAGLGEPTVIVSQVSRGQGLLTYRPTCIFLPVRHPEFMNEKKDMRCTKVGEVIRTLGATPATLLALILAALLFGCAQATAVRERSDSIADPPRRRSPLRTGVRSSRIGRRYTPLREPVRAATGS